MSYNDYKTWDYGDLRVTLTKDYGWTYDDTGSGAGSDLSTYAVYGSATMRPLGTTAARTINDTVNGKRATLLVGANPNSPSATPAVAAPTDFTEIKRITTSKHPATVWRPVAPPGYVAMGDVITYSTTKPGTSNFWCLRRNLTVASTYEATSVWWHGSNMNLSVWNVIPENPGGDGTSKFPILAGTFRVATARERPSADLAVLPVLELPRRMDRFTAQMPSFTKATRPTVGDRFSSTEQASVVLPFIAFLPSTDLRSLDKIRNPFLKVSRAGSWYVEAVWDNSTNGPLEKQKEVTKGINSTQSTEMTNSAGVNISASFGIKGAQYDVSLNYQFTYTTSSSYTEYKESKDTVKYTVSPMTCVVVLSQHISIKGERLDGSATLSSIETAVNEEIHLTSFDL